MALSQLKQKAVSVSTTYGSHARSQQLRLVVL